MAIYIIKPWYRKKSHNIDDYFDPTTHTATLNNFIKFLGDGIYTTEVIGYKVTIDTGRDWIIADLDHDSENTGQTNCYDLVPDKLYLKQRMNQSVGTYYGSDIRTYLNTNNSTGFMGEYLPPKLINRMMKIKYYSGSWRDSDYVTLLSYTEVALSSQSYFAQEGVTYPIFGLRSTRRKTDLNGDRQSWWTRSVSDSRAFCLVVDNYGDANTSARATDSYYLLPIIRVQ